MSKRSTNRARSALLRLLIASQDELLVLEAAARMVRGAEAKRWLRERCERRIAFGRELSAALVVLGGVPAAAPSVTARFWQNMRNLRWFLAGPHVGDAYAACARAAANSLTAYSSALELELPEDVRLVLSRQAPQIDQDRIALRRIRWGASLRAPTGPTVNMPDSVIGTAAGGATAAMNERLTPGLKTVVVF